MVGLLTFPPTWMAPFLTERPFPANTAEGG